MRRLSLVSCQIAGKILKANRVPYRLAKQAALIRLMDGRYMQFRGYDREGNPTFYLANK